MESEFTLESFKEVIRSFEQLYRKPKYQIPCSDFEWMSDEEFISFLKSAGEDKYIDWEFIGGTENYNKVRERMKKLNLE